jgi:hypothetical protein
MVREPISVGYIPEEECGDLTRWLHPWEIVREPIYQLATPLKKGQENPIFFSAGVLAHTASLVRQNI